MQKLEALLGPPGGHEGELRGCWSPAGLRQRREVVGRSAIFGGEQFVLEETDWYLLNVFRLWWYYGISFLRLQMWVEEVMEKFMR